MIVAQLRRDALIPFKNEESGLERHIASSIVLYCKRSTGPEVFYTVNDLQVLSILLLFIPDISYY